MITCDQALTANMFYTNSAYNRDGSPCRARRNGRTKTWKTRPGEFRIPVKYGLRDCFYITHLNAHFWFDSEDQARSYTLTQGQKDKAAS